MTAVDDRAAVTCPPWCTECQPDGVREAINHWSTPSPLPGSDRSDVEVEPAAMEAYVRIEEPGHPMPEPVFLIRSHQEHVRSYDQARAFAEAILSFVDKITGALVVDDRGQAADLDGYEPQNR